MFLTVRSVSSILSEELEDNMTDVAGLNNCSRVSVKAVNQRLSLSGNSTCTCTEACVGHDDRL